MNLTRKQREYVKRLEDRIGILKRRKRGSMLRDTQEITKELHALEWAVSALAQTDISLHRQEKP